MKKILFVIPSLGSGGAEKSLLSVLQSLDYNEYETDILAIRPEGMIAGMLPVNVNVLPEPKDFDIFSLSPFKSATAFLKKGKPFSAANRLLYSAVLKKYGYSNIAEQHAYKFFAKNFRGKYGHYDAAIGYLEKTSDYLVSDAIDADVKIGYIHSDYDKLKLDGQYDQKLMKNLDFLVTVSDSCGDILKKALPGMSDKVRIIENIISKDLIEEQSREKNPFTDSFNGIRITTVGRISQEKGPDIAVDACKILVEKGFDIKWHWIGLYENSDIRKMIDDNGLHNRFILEGLNPNPYKFTANSDIYVQPSRFEGKSIAIEEAKVLGIPVVLTNFTTAPSQITDGSNGIIAGDISAAALADAIIKLIENRALYEKIRENLKKENGNSDEILKLYALINSK